MADQLRPRRSCLAVPGSNPRFLEKAQGLDADQVFLDLEDSVAPLAKPAARGRIVDALNDGGWGDEGPGRSRQRLDDRVDLRATSSRSSRAPGANLDAIMLPKVQTADQVVALDLLLTQIEKTMGFEVGRIGIEAQIENALGLINVDAIAAGQPAGRDDHLRAGRLHGVAST